MIVLKLEKWNWRTVVSFLSERNHNNMEGKESLERIFAQLSDEQKEQFRNCKDIDEVKKLADAENVELTDEQLEFLASGGCGCEGCYRKCSAHSRENQFSPLWRAS